MFSYQDEDQSALSVGVEDDKDFSRRLSKVVEDICVGLSDDFETESSEWEAASSFSTFEESEENADLLLCAGSYI